ncbi:hypothetical protein [Jeotgalibacillus haloalkalitolerans]|uniref:Uncharacterized protein n=1 Tax=Jeotgalibacillus haloalkalitolerans TaxID=3104292 RepID=A0ABU5KNH5_9BACL|nr:hypothetical protein [Jeotgalibacillus sp. HH7-29]MDZ5712633.1 hypothetical protein [Jeotgalibacillus sp. HH7-29]
MTINEINFLGYYKNRDLLGSNSWESFNNYKLLNAEQLKFDCDRSNETKKALKKIFGEAQYTDTLISPQSYVTLYMRYYHSDLLAYSERYKKLIVPDISGLKKQMVSEGIAQNTGKIKNQAVWAFFAKKNDIHVHESMLDFLQAVYTLPNFSSVCRGFNIGRAAKTKDNFIIALHHIYHYFKNREVESSNLDSRAILTKFLSSNHVRLTQDEVVTEVQNWLDRHSSFASFIETYYLQDFLEDPGNTHSSPKELWEGIFDGKLQPSKQEFIPAITFFTDAIKSRGDRMSAVY